MVKALISNLGIRLMLLCSQQQMENILQNLLCFITTHCSALSMYYSTWVNTGARLRAVHMTSRGGTFQPAPCSSKCLISSFHPRASADLSVFHMREQLLLTDAFLSGQCQSFSFPSSPWHAKDLSSRFPLKSFWNLKKINSPHFFMPL